MKKNIKLKILGTGYGKYCQANVQIYDLKNNLIYKKQTFNGCLNVCLCTNQYYLIKAFLNGQMINRVIYINNYQDNYTLVFNNILLNNNFRIFNLTDRNYPRLPIKNGRLILWQKQ